MFDIFWCGLICVDMVWYVSIWFYISDKLWYVLTSVDMSKMYVLMCFETVLCADIYLLVYVSICFDDLIYVFVPSFGFGSRQPLAARSSEWWAARPEELHPSYPSRGWGSSQLALSPAKSSKTKRVISIRSNSGPSLTESQGMFWTQSWLSEVNSGMLAGLTGLDGDWSCFTLEAGRRRTLRLVRLTGISLRLSRCNMGQRESHKTFLRPLLITAVRLCIGLIWLTGCCPNAPRAVGHGYQQDQE